MDKAGYDAHGRKLLRAHPLWPALDFIPHLDEEACAKLITVIFDPRWYVDPAHPSRGSRLRKYLGLDLKTVEGVLDRGPKQRLHRCAELVLKACGNEIAKADIERPENFLWRIHHAAGEKSGKTAVAKLRMMQTFVEFLRLCWIAALGMRRHQNESLFVPEYFFKEKHEADAFIKHLITKHTARKSSGE
jgi:hypothetical protein